ncbi:MAG: hypothetical protein JST16_06175 [Bdellovibrionales bacterium]|nr:hypothetical protein [Bdellovibrionales bacterium]
MKKIVARGEPFAIGSVVVPARDGMLARLGHDVAALGSQALGFVIESRPQKCLVQFFDLNLTLWLERDELADIDCEARAGHAAFQNLLPQLESTQVWSPVWCAWALAKRLPVSHVLGFERGTVAEIWPENPAQLAEYFAGDSSVPAFYLGLGVGEFKLAEWHGVEKLLGDQLLFARFLPAGMHKLELAIYVRDPGKARPSGS